MNKLIYCCECQIEVDARLTDGREIYSHREDLHDLPFWKCDSCNNFVGCHHKTTNRTKPLGNIPSPEIKEARKHIHKLLDPLWNTAKDKRNARGKVYGKISARIGKEYHTAEIKTLDEAREIYKIILEIRKTYE